MRTLKQKRMYEAQLAQLTQQTFNIESTALATENLRNTMVTLDAMTQANKELRKQYGKIDIGKIEVRHSFRGGRTLSSSPHERPRLIAASLLDNGDRRICNTTWRSFWSRRTRSKSRLADPMPSRTRLTRRILKQVRLFPVLKVMIFGSKGLNTELDALGMEEEEGESYLADLNKAPDFIDEAPIEDPQVRHL